MTFGDIGGAMGAKRRAVARFTAPVRRAGATSSTPPTGTSRAWASAASASAPRDRDRVVLATRTASAARTRTIVEAAALGWLRQRPGAVIPIVGAREPARLEDRPAASTSSGRRRSWPDSSGLGGRARLPARLRPRGAGAAGELRRPVAADRAPARRRGPGWPSEHVCGDMSVRTC